MLNELKNHTSHGGLVALGLKIIKEKVLEPIEKWVNIKQKTILDTPIDKLTDALIGILSGISGLVEINKTIRPDEAVQRAFGRERCAEQSVINETFNACTAENVLQMQQANKLIFQQHSQSYAHPYPLNYQILDIDLSGLPCGKQAAFATKGYFAGERNRRGHQIGRVLASHYNEIVLDRLFPGNTVLPAVLPELVKAAADILNLSASQRARTILRIDRHGGSQDNLNEMLNEGYQVHTKEYSTARARKLADSVTRWYDDPRHPERQVGLVKTAPLEYDRPLTRIAVRTRKKNQQWGVGVLISTLPTEAVGFLVGFRADDLNQPANQLLAYVYFYDQRGGGVECSLKQDKQGLGIVKRNMKKFSAQQMMTELNALAHNLLVWFQQSLAQCAPFVLGLGIMRLIRDVLHINSQVVYDKFHTIKVIKFNSLDQMARKLQFAFQFLFDPEHLDIILDKT
jgi:hypothetical protein